MLKITIKVLFIPVIMLLMISACKTASTGASEKNLKDNISAILKENPEMILDILRENDMKILEIVESGAQHKREALARQQREAEFENPLRPEVGKNRIVRGNPDAPILIVEYSDFECPFCAKASLTIEKILEKYGDKVKLVYKHNPLQNHKNALFLAVSFEAIARQDAKKAWEFHDAIFGNRNIAGGSEMEIKTAIQSLGIDMQKYEQDMKDAGIINLIQSDVNEARKFGFNGTPSFLINGVSIRGALPENAFIEIIEKHLERLGERG